MKTIHAGAKSKLNSTGETVDYSSAINWSGNLKVDDLNVIQTWDYGFRHSKTILINYGYKTDDFYLSNDVTMLRPFEKKNRLIDDNNNCRAT